MKKNEYNDLKLPPGDSEEIVRATMIAELSCGVTGTTADLDRAMALLERLTAGFMDECRKIGVAVSFPRGTFRPMTKEEALAFTPRKFHYAPDGERVCRTEFVSRQQLTADRGKVTCKLCLKWMEENGERLEAGGGQKAGRAKRQGPGPAASGEGEEGHEEVVPGKGRD